MINSELVPNFIQMKGTFKFDYKDSIMEYVEANTLSSKPKKGIENGQMTIQSPDYSGLDSNEYKNGEKSSFFFENLTDGEMVSSFNKDYFYNEIKYEYRSLESSNLSKKVDYYKHKNKHDPKEVDTFQLSIKIDTTLGSKEMIYFLFHYSNSKCNDFINSKWRYLVIERWIKFWPVHLLFAIFYWVFTLCVTIMIILESKSSGLYMINFILTILLFLINFIRFIGFFRAKR
jgi:hypothetical protein